MLELNLPPFEKKIIQNGDKAQIFDVIRKRYVALTPEEWVRQHFVHFLIEQKGYPLSHMSNEQQVKLNGMSRRCDTVLYDSSLQPLLIAEYKAPNIQITQKTFDQICRYNIVLKVKYLIVSNGMRHFCCKVDYDNNSYTFLPDIPAYEELK